MGPITADHMPESGATGFVSLPIFGMFSITDCRRLVDGLDHPECVTVRSDGWVYSGGEAGQVYRFTMSNAEPEIFADVGGFVAGVTIAEGHLVVCDAGNRRVVAIGPQGDISSLTEGTPLSFPNFTAFDPEGNLYITDSGDYYRDDGRLLVRRPSGSVEVLISSGLAYPNGLAVDPAGRWLYLAQSKGHDILRYPLGTSSWDEPEVYAELPGKVPDGLALAANGSLYVGCYTPDEILSIDPDGNSVTVVSDPGADMLNRPTNLAFAGSTLLFANLGGYHIGALDIDDHGAPLHVGAI